MPNPCDESFETLSNYEKTAILTFFCNESWCSQGRVKNR